MLLSLCLHFLFFLFLGAEKNALVVSMLKIVERRFLYLELLREEFCSSQLPYSALLNFTEKFAAYREIKCMSALDNFLQLLDFKKSNKEGLEILKRHKIKQVLDAFEMNQE